MWGENKMREKKDISMIYVEKERTGGGGGVHGDK